jgi:hypothetical protein
VFIGSPANVRLPHWLLNAWDGTGDGECSPPYAYYPMKETTQADISIILYMNSMFLKRDLCSIDKKE